jgi:hypothetical protein
LKTLIPQKLSGVSFTNPKQIHGGAAIAKPLIAENNAEMRKRWCRDHKTWTETTGSEHVVWSDEPSFTLFPTSAIVYVWRTQKEAFNPECLVLFQQ